MSWDPSDFLSRLVKVGWYGKGLVKEGAMDMSCLSLSLLVFSSFCLTLSMII